MQQLKGLFYFFIAPFAPRAIFNRMDKDNGKNTLYFLALIVAVIITMISVTLQKSRLNYDWKGAFYSLGIGFMVIVSSFIMGGLIRLLAARLTQSQMPYIVAVNCFTLTLLPYLLTLSYAFYFPNYKVLFYLSFLWTLILLTIGIWKLTKCTLGKSMLVSFSCAMLYFIVRVSFYDLSI